MSDVLDLDALAPKPALIKFDGAEITVNPPKLSDYLMLNSIISRLSEAPDNESVKIDALNEELENFFWRVIPELNGKKLHKLQLETLSRVFVDMATPPQTKELEANGVTLEPAKKEQQN